MDRPPSTSGHNDGVTVYDLDSDGRAEVAVRIANGVTFGNGTTFTNSDNNRQFIAILDGRTGAPAPRAAVPTDYLSDGPMYARFGVGYLDGVTPSLVAYMKNRIGSGYFNLMMIAWKFTGSAVTHAVEVAARQPERARRAQHPHHRRRRRRQGRGRRDRVRAQRQRHPAVLARPAGRRARRPVPHREDGPEPGRACRATACSRTTPAACASTTTTPATGTMIWQHVEAGVADVGRGMAGDIDPRFPGMEAWSFSGVYNAPTNRLTQAGTALHPWPQTGLFWDGDTTMELLNNGKFEKWNPPARRAEPAAAGVDLERSARSTPARTSSPPSTVTSSATGAKRSSTPTRLQRTDHLHHEPADRHPALHAGPQPRVPQRHDPQGIHAVAPRRLLPRRRHVPAAPAGDRLRGEVTLLRLAWPVRSLGTLSLLGPAMLGAVLSAGPPAAGAHPPGQTFAIYQYEGLTLTPDRVRVTAVLNTAELVTGQDRRAVDADHDGPITAAERTGYAPVACASLAADFDVSVDGQRLAWTIPDRTSPSTRQHRWPAQRTARCHLEAPARLATPATVVINSHHRADLAGWRELTAAGDDVHLIDSLLPQRSVSDELRAVPPADALTLDVRTAALQVRPGPAPTGTFGPSPPDDQNRATVAAGQRHQRWLEAVTDPPLELLLVLLALLVVIVVGAASAHRATSARPGTARCANVPDGAAGDLSRG